MPNRALILLFPFFLVGVSLAGCQFEERVDLLRVVRVDPSSASGGDRITIWGEGFPEGRPATLTFQGDVYRPAMPPEHDVRFTARATPGPRGAVVLLWDADLERRLTGSRASAAHATFRGDLRVVFEPAAHGVLPIGGTYRGLSFDVLPSSVDADAAAQRERAGADTLAFVGASVTTETASAGLRIASLNPEGAFYRAGVRAGDRLLDLDGVNVVGASDLRVAPGEATASVGVERNGRPLPHLSVDVRGLAPPSAQSFAFAGALILLVCAVFGLFASPLAFVAGFVGRLGALKRSAPARLGSRRALPERSPNLASLGADTGLGTALASAAVLAVVAFGFASLAMGRPVVSGQIDLLLAALAAPSALFVARLADGGFGGRRGFSLKGALGAAGRSLSALGPALVSLAGLVFSTGRFVVEEIVADQGGVPWRWAAARNPGLFVLFLVLYASTVPESGHRGPISAEGLEQPSPPRSAARVLVRLAESSYLFVTSGLATALFLGGWRVPGVATMVQESSRRLEALGVALFFVKFAALVGGVHWLRRAATRVFVEDVSRPLARWGFATSLPAACVAVGWAAAFDGARTQLPSDLLGYASVGLGIGCAAFAVLGRVRRSVGHSVSTVNPWI